MLFEFVTCDITSNDTEANRRVAMPGFFDVLQTTSVVSATVHNNLTFYSFVLASSFATCFRSPMPFSQDVD